jgi:fucose permease
MTSSTSAPNMPPVTTWHILSTRAAFFAAGFAAATWAPLVPFVKDRLGINNATLGLLLLCLGGGAITAMLASGALVSRFGCRRVISLSVIVIAAMFPLLGSVGDPFAIGLVLALFGAAIGTMDVAMNVHAAAVEQRSRRKMMSGFHALYSIGGLAGAGSTACALSLGAAPVTAATLAALLLVLSLAVYGRHLLSEVVQQPGSILVMPHGRVLLLGAMCMMLFLVEGAMLNWSALLLTTTKSLSPRYAGIGYAVFSGAMTATRLAGDWTASRMGARLAVRLGSVLGAAGVALAAFAPDFDVALAGFTLMGIGCANIVPILYSAAGSQQSMPSERAIAATATLGYAGILAGPALVGFIAHGSSLTTAFALLGLLLVAVSAAANVVPSR